MSNIDDLFNMNLHEECLLKYLVNPLELYFTTELLKNNNLLLQKMSLNEEELAKNGKWKVESRKLF